MVSGFTSTDCPSIAKRIPALKEDWVRELVRQWIQEYEGIIQTRYGQSQPQNKWRKGAGRYG
jgi:hypothetical protein